MADIYVSTTAQLLSALSSARGGDNILLKSGNYGALNLSNVDFASTVTIKSVTKGGANFTGIDLVGCSNIRIDGVRVDTRSNTGTDAVLIENSTSIDFVNSEVSGSVGQAYPISGPTHGIFVRGTSSDIVIANNDVHHVLNGITFFGTKNFVARANEVDYVGSDGFKFSAVDGGLIVNNFGPRFIHSTADAHEDFMQFQGPASSNLVIRGNVSLPQNVTDVQGIFMGGDGGHSNIVIEQNIIYTKMLNGIAVFNGTNIDVRSNTVINAVGDGRTSTIRLEGGSGHVVEDNITSGSSGGVNGSNIVIQQSSPTGAYYYGKLFSGLMDGGAITLADLTPVAGSAATTFGAYERLTTLLGGSNESSPTSTLAPTPTPTPEPIGFTPIFNLAGDKVFSGANADIIDVAHKAALELKEGTIAFSFNADTVAGKQGLISKDAAGYTGGGNHLAVWVNNGALVVRFEDESSSSFMTVKGIQAGREYDVRATFDAGQVALYLDDQKVGEKAFTMDWTTNKQYLHVGGLGSGGGDASNAFDGTISDVRIFNEALSPQDFDLFA